MDIKELIDILWDLHMEAYGKWVEGSASEYWKGKADSYLEIYELLSMEAPKSG